MAVRLVILTGTYVTSQHASAVIDSADFGGGRFTWGRRVDRMYAPDEARAAFGWQHEGQGIPFAISAVTPNAPVAGDTRITLSGGHLRAVGTEAKLRITGTGTDFDGEDTIVAEVTGASELVVRGRVASGSAASGTCNMGYLSLYHGDTHGNTDDTYGGAYPSTTMGPDYRAVALIQDAIQADAATEDDTFLLVKLAPTTQALRGRDTDQRGRWLLEFEGEGKADGSGTMPDGAFLCVGEDFRYLMRDVRSVLEGIGTANADILVQCLVIGAGLNDGNLANASLGRAFHTISSVAINGTDLEITTSAAHGVSKLSGKSYPVGKITGLSADPDSIEGRFYELEAVDTDTLRLRDFTPSLVPTLGTGAKIETGDPGFWFADDIASHVDALRGILAEEFSSVTAAEVRTILINCDHSTPNAVHTAARNAINAMPGLRDSLSVIDLADYSDGRSNSAVLTLTTPLLDESSLTTTAGGGTALDPPTLTRAAGGLSQFHVGEAIAVQFSGGNLHLAYVTEITSDTLLKVHHNPTVFGGAEIPFADLTANGIVYRIWYPEDTKFYNLDTTLKLGEAIAEHALSAAAITSVEAKKPAVVVALIGDSYGIGKPVTAFILDDDPRLISSAAVPQEGHYVWNETTRQFEQQFLDTPNAEHGSGQNINTHRDWNYAQLQANAGQVSVQPALLRGLRERFPDENVFLLNLAFNGSTAGLSPGTLNPKSIVGVTVNPTFVLIEVAYSAELAVSPTRQVAVTINGVSGLSTSINGLHTNATTASAGSSTFISIPVVTSGTPSFASATLTVRPASWSPAAGELWDSWRDDIVLPAFDWLWENGYIPDVRAAFVLLGYNDAAQGISADFGESVDEITTAMRALLTTRALPRDELPVVWLNPILHDELSSERRTAIETCRTALGLKAAADSAFSVLTLDQDPDWLEYHAIISDDDIHPTLAGYSQIGYRLARTGLAGVSAFEGDHPVDFTPQAPVGGVVP